jgi:hypothetical protein
VASNRTVKQPDQTNILNKIDVPVRYLVEKKIELFKAFQYAEELSKTTFLKYFNNSGVYKNPFR